MIIKAIYHSMTVPPYDGFRIFLKVALIRLDHLTQNGGLSIWEVTSKIKLLPLNIDMLKNNSTNLVQIYSHFIKLSGVISGIPAIK